MPGARMNMSRFDARMTPVLRFLFRLFAVLGCALHAGVGLAATLDGTAFYRERIALPPGAVFEVVLLEVGAADASSRPVARARHVPPGPPPFVFQLNYDGAAIRSGVRYVVRARIEHEGRALFTTAHDIDLRLDGTDAPVRLLLVSGRGEQSARQAMPGSLPATFRGELPGADATVAWHVDLLAAGRYQWRQSFLGKPEPNQFDDIGRWRWDSKRRRIEFRGSQEQPVYFELAENGALRKLDLAGRRIDSAHNDLLSRQADHEPIEPRLQLTGMFSYLADAATIVLCANGERLPIAMEGDYRAIEAAYAAARESPGRPVLARLEARIALRPSAEAGKLPLRTVVVERFIDLRPRENCGQPIAASQLRNTYWRLVRLEGESVQAVVQQREPHLVFAAEGERVSGSGGCNRLLGTFAVDGERIELSPMAATRMACPEGMAQERRFVRSLEQVVRYRIHGSHLELFADESQAVARFEAVVLP